jgi:hypothetical protein
MPRVTAHQPPPVDLSPEKLARLVRAPEYFARYPKLFPYVRSWVHFVTKRRAVLEEKGLIVRLSSFLWVDAEALDRELGTLLTSGDGRPVPRTGFLFDETTPNVFVDRRAAGGAEPASTEPASTEPLSAGS